MINKNNKKNPWEIKWYHGLIILGVLLGLLKQGYTHAGEVKLLSHHFRIPPEYYPEHEVNGVQFVADFPNLNPPSYLRVDSPGSPRKLSISLTDKEAAICKPYTRPDGSRFDMEAEQKYKKKGMQNVIYVGSNQDFDYFVTKDMLRMESCGRSEFMSRCTAQFPTLYDISAFTSFTADHFDDFPKVVEWLKPFLKAHETEP